VRKESSRINHGRQLDGGRWLHLRGKGPAQELLLLLLQMLLLLLLIVLLEVLWCKI